MNAAFNQLHLGTVLDNADPESRGRIKVKLHGTGLESWAAVLVASAGAGYGVSALPRNNEQVVVAFLSGNDPVVLGALWSGNGNHPGDARPVEERYQTSTPGGLKVLLDDNEKRVRIETPGGQSLTITDSGGGSVTINKGNDKIEMGPSGITLKTAGNIVLDATALKVSANLVTVDSGFSSFSGVAKADTVISNTVTSATYTPGAGNVW